MFSVVLYMLSENSESGARIYLKKIKLNNLL